MEDCDQGGKFLKQILMAPWPRTEQVSHETFTTTIVSRFYPSISIGCRYHSVDKWRRNGVKCLQNFRRRKGRFRFYESALSLNEFLRYESLTDCPQIWPENSPDVERKNGVRDFVFQN